MRRCASKLAWAGDEMYETYGILAYAAFLLVLATFCLLFPRRVQALAIAIQDRGWGTKMKWANKFIRSGSYLWNVRFVGVIALLMASLLLWVFILKLNDYR